MTQGPGSGRVAESATRVTIEALVASVQCKGQRVRILVEGRLPRAGDLPRQSLGLESRKLLANGTWSSNGEPGCLATLLQRAGRGFLSCQGLLVREAGGGGLGGQCHTRAARVGRVLCTIHHGERRWLGQSFCQV